MNNPSPEDVRHMARALRLAKNGLYTTDPNPRVGCVIVRDSQVVGEGWHRRAGEAHAEVHALAAAGRQAHGATAYVSLEPCCHHGRTPPCSEALVKAGIARVVAAMPDPNPRVASRGVAELERAGIRVDIGLLQAEAERLNPGFISRMTRGRPYVRVKLAASLDGRTALANGESKWITGVDARADVQRLRAQFRDSHRYRHRPRGQPIAHRARPRHRAPAVASSGGCTPPHAPGCADAEPFR